MEPWSEVLLVIGVVLLLEAVPYFGFPELFRGFAEQISHVAPRRLRQSGFVMMVLGLLVLLLRRALFV
jgi:uncharacterized protein YjeT (DUF2065 family)